jgi:hypothetical protein
VANDFPARAEAIADEIAAAKPDLVGLQEATLYRTDVPPDGPATRAETVALDFLATLEAALQARGLSYEAVTTFSCCHAVDLHNPNPTLTKRIDLVLTRAGSRRCRRRSSARRPQTARPPASGLPTTPASSRPCACRTSRKKATPELARRSRAACAVQAARRAALNRVESARKAATLSGRNAWCGIV